MSVTSSLTLLASVFACIIAFCAALSCYQCDSRYDPDCKEHFDWSNIDQMILRPTECTVDSAQYCIKTTGVWGGIVGTTRFCSSRDMFNSCQYVEYPDHDRIYRACIFTCNSDNCNGSIKSIAPTSLITVAIVAIVSLVLTMRC